MKTIFKIHVLFYLTALVSFLTGYFYNFILFTQIILVHELGHIIGGIIFKWKIEKIIILPFGGITFFNTKINLPVHQEIIVTLLGPILQTSLFLIDNQYLKQLNIIILLFNLIPILPLDGSKIVNIILNKFFSYYYSLIISCLISLTLIISMLLKFNFNLILIFILIFLLKNTYINFINKNQYLKKLILEKYLYKFNFKKRKIIKNIKQFKKNTNHIILVKNKYLTEKEFLRKMFDI